MARTSLVFITLDYEAAEEPTHSDPAFKLTFCPTRWFIFYRHLKAHLNGDGLAKELKLFMEENRMSLGNQFRSTDLVAMENFLGATALMNETLDGEVSNALKNILGELWPITRALGKYLRDENRYVVSNCDWGTVECHIGYWLPHANPDETIWVGITIYSNPSAKTRKDVTAAFRNWLETARGWSSEELDDVKAKSSIYKGQPLPALMGGKDHVRAIKDYFLSLLEELRQFRREYPKLGWNAGGIAVCPNPEE